MYSFLFHGKGLLVFRTDNADEAGEVIRKGNLRSITEKDLSDWQ